MMNRSASDRFSLRPALLIVLCLLLAGCAAGTVNPYRNGEAVTQETATEVRLWDQSNEFDESLGRTEQILGNLRLQAYLQQIMDRLYPDFNGAIKVKVLRAPVLNAFALPNGSVYIHVSLVARCDNEAQVATILAHEGAHFVGRHSVAQSSNAKLSSAFANALTLAGIPLVGPLLAVSSISGYSRQLEEEADTIGYQRLLQAGYDPAEAVVIFQRMAEETKLLDQDEPFFFSTHPRMKERVKHFEIMLAEQPDSGTFTGSEEFLQQTADLRVASLQEDLSMKRSKCVIRALEGDQPPVGYPAHYQFFLGEAYRQRGDEGDTDRALAAYRAAIAAAPDFPGSYRALGLYFLKQRDDAKAQHYLETYLNYEPSASERNYVKYYLTKLKQRGEP